MTLLDYLKANFGVPTQPYDFSQSPASMLMDQSQAPADASTPPSPAMEPQAPISAPAMPSLSPMDASALPVPSAGDMQTAPAAPTRSIWDRLSDPGIARMLLSGGAALMSAGGPSRMPVSTGQALGEGIQQGGSAFDQYRAMEMQRKAQQQAMGANQWTTLTPAQLKAKGLQDPGPGYQLQVNGNGELRSVGQDVIRSTTDSNGMPALVDTRHLGSGAPGQSSVPKTVDATVDLIGKYQVPLQTALARVPWAVRGIVQQRLAEKYPGYQAENFNMYNKGYRDFGTGQQGNTVRSMNVGIAHLDTLGQLADALHNGNVPLLNKVANAWKLQTGSAAPTNFDSAKNVVAQELVKAITGYPGAASDREAAAAEIKNDNSPEQLKGTIETYQKLLAGQLAGLKGQYQHSTGRDDFEQAMNLNPETLQKLGGGAPAASVDPSVKAMSNADLLQALGIGGPSG